MTHIFLVHDYLAAVLLRLGMIHGPKLHIPLDLRITRPLIAQQPEQRRGSPIGPRQHQQHLPRLHASKRCIQDDLVGHLGSTTFDLVGDVEEGEEIIVEDCRGGFALDGKVVPGNAELLFGEDKVRLFLHLDDLSSRTLSRDDGQRKTSAHLFVQRPHILLIIPGRFEFVFDVGLNILRILAVVFSVQEHYGIVGS